MLVVVEEVVRWVEDLVWKQEYWLPPGVSWADMDRLAHSKRPLPRDLLLALPLALAFVALRYMFERYVAPPMARCVGVRNRVQVMAAPSPKLEAFYTLRSRQPTQSQIVGLSTQSGKTHRQVQAWFRLRRDQDRPCHTKKFGEAAWRFLFYITAFLAGLACLIDKPWFWDPKECWRNYPLQPMEKVHYWYYMLELGFYTSLLLRIYKDIRRKDFKEQVIHHFATIFLLSFSYCANYIRVGTLVMLLHDSSDIVLESAKMFNYGTGWRRTCDNMFIVFTVVFLLTRLVIFPTVIMKTTLFSSMEIFQPFLGYYFFNVLLMVLQALHIFWAGLILRMAYKFIFLGKLDKDERSDEESEEEEEDKDKECETDKNADYSWERTESLNCKLSSSCVLQNLANHRSSAANRMRKAQ